MKDTTLLPALTSLAICASAVRLPEDLSDGLTQLSASTKRDGGWEVVEEYSSTEARDVEKL
jgi:hypothetical protein